MKAIATCCDAIGGIAIVYGPDFCDQEITVNGRVWRFNFDRMGGPEWLRKDGYTRKCQSPGKAVWAAFEVWFKKNVERKVKP